MAKVLYTDETKENRLIGRVRAVVSIFTRYRCQTELSFLQKEFSGRREEVDAAVAALLKHEECSVKGVEVIITQGREKRVMAYDALV